MAKAHNPLRIGFVGGGMNSAIGRVHHAAITLDNKFELIGGCFSRDQAVSRQTATMYGLDEEKGYASIKTLLEDGNPDVVAILTPSPSHRMCLGELALSGLPIICEKPLVTCLDDLQQIDTVVARSQPLFVTYNYTGYPMVREARDIIRQNELGKVVQVVMEMPQDGLIRPPRINGVPKPPQTWRLHDGVIPNVCLDLASHLIQMMRFVTGEEVAQASAIFTNHSRFTKIYDTAHVSGVLTNGAAASFWVTKSAHGYRNGLNFRIFCEAGSVFWDQSDPEILRIGKADGSVKIIDRSSACHEGFAPRYDRMKVGHPAGFIEAFANHYADIHDAICQKHGADNFVFGRDDAFEELQLLENLAIGGSYVRSVQSGNRDVFACTVPSGSRNDRLGCTDFADRIYRFSGHV